MGKKLGLNFHSGPDFFPQILECQVLPLGLAVFLEGQTLGLNGRNSNFRVLGASSGVGGVSGGTKSEPE